VRLPLIFLAVAACSSDADISVGKDCNPLGFAGHCAVPWPSSVYEVADASTPTGRKLKIPNDTLPKNFNGDVIDPTMWNLADGFSPSAPMIVAFPGGVSADGLPPIDNYDLSLSAESPTVVLDMTTGERVPHFAELDTQAADNPNSQALLVRPAMRLVGGHRYAVAITKKVTAANGGELPISPGFAALRDGTHTDNALLETMRPRFADVLSALATAGFPKSDLVLAWDFTVASDDFLHREMIAARDRALAAIANHPINYTIKTDAPDPGHAGIARFVTGTLEAPLFLNTPALDVNGTVVVHDADGLPAVQGTYQIPFSAVIPECAYTSPTPVPMIIYGHGLLGDSTEVDCCGVPPVAVDLCMVIAGTDLRGMSENDTTAVARALNDATQSDQVFEVLDQGLANFVVMAQAMRTTMAQTLFVDAASGNKVLVDPDKLYYFGLSEGGIFGASVMAYEPTITRGVLGSGAANYSLLLDRSADWPKYRAILNGAYSDPLDDELLIHLMQMRWDKTEPSGIANSVLEGAPTGVPPKQLLMQIALGDEQVGSFAAYWEARTMKVPVVGPSVVSPWGLTTQAAPLPSGSALVVYDCGAPPLSLTNVAPPQTPCAMAGTEELHDLPAHVAAGRRQMKDFFATGQIVNECNGACTCTTGACQ
jgi:hypothetical protein